mmetsp:Transcript_6033/g.9053  ORF Transcript_6033/g.9053 Transcript_6033/m.9053 type:complete len:83 (+) Transcript_6033:213-461(+)
MSMVEVKLMHLNISDDVQLKHRSPLQKFSRRHQCINFCICLSKASMHLMLLHILDKMLVKHCNLLQKFSRQHQEVQVMHLNI